MQNAIERLAQAIGYPETIPEGAVSFEFRVDDVPIVARMQGGALQLRWAFPPDLELGKLVGFAAGRLLREEAVLAWDPASERAILWQGAPKGADDRALVRTFQAFLNSRDWWDERVRELTAPKTKLADLVIRP